MQYFTKQSLLSETDPGFIVDVILRANGTIHMVFDGLLWEDALVRSLSALEDHLSVQIVESDYEDCDSPFADEFDRQE